MLNLLCCYRNPSPKWLLGTQPSAEDAPAPFSWSPYLSHGSPLSRQRADRTRGGEVSLPQSLESWMPDCPQLFKVMLLGDEAAGKTCLLLRFTDKKYRTKHSTIGVEFGSRNVDVQGEAIRLQCWDCAGADRFRSIICKYHRGAAGALLVYDITRRDSFEHIQEWLHHFQEHTDTGLAITLVGNKADMDAKRQVSFEEGSRFATDHGLGFLETSAVTGQHVEDAFLVTARQALARRPTRAAERQLDIGHL
ncbi:RAB2A [Symbiodinium sp. CCMP2592]|nr:RAB2A [Symbiodinium sp. CCMP2592]